MTERDSFILGLRQMADFFGMHPEVKCPSWGHNFFVGIQASEVRRTARALKSFKKNYEGHEFQMLKSFGPHTIQFYTDRENVCKKVVVGTKDVPEMIIAAKPEQLIPASEEQVIPAHTEEITEWVCSDAALMEEEEISA